MRKFTKLLIAGTALTAFGTVAAKADVTPILVGAAPVPIASVFQYDYLATLYGNQTLESGNYFTIYDFAGFTGFGPIPVNFIGTTSLIGATPNLTTPFDDPAVVNVTFTYLGNSIATGAMGTFTLFSSIGDTTVGVYSSVTTNQSIGVAGTPVDAVGNVLTPLSSDGIGATVPEPGVWALMIAGFGLVGVSMRRRSPTLVIA